MFAACFHLVAGRIRPNPVAIAVAVGIQFVLEIQAAGGESFAEVSEVKKVVIYAKTRTECQVFNRQPIQVSIAE